MRPPSRPPRPYAFNVICRCAIGCLLLLGLAAAWAQDEYPSPQGYVNDFARVLDAATTRQLAALLQDLERRTGVEMAVVVVQTTQPLTPKQYVTELFNRWGVGKRGADNGVMLLLAVGDRRVEVETGYGVEGVLPDGRVGAIIRTAMLPAFRDNRWGEGLLAGTREIAQVLSEHYQAPQAPTAPPAPATGLPGLIYGLGWGYFLLWLGFLAMRRFRNRPLAWGTWLLITLPGLAFVFVAFLPFVVPLLLGVLLSLSPGRRRCPVCGHTLSSRSRVVREPSVMQTGLREAVYDCPACGYHDVQMTAIPRRVRVITRPPMRPPVPGWPGAGFPPMPTRGPTFRRFGGGSSGGGGAGASF